MNGERRFQVGYVQPPRTHDPGPRALDIYTRRETHMVYRTIPAARARITRLIKTPGYKGRCWIEDYRQPATRHVRDARGALHRVES